MGHKPRNLTLAFSRKCFSRFSSNFAQWWNFTRAIKTYYILWPPSRVKVTRADSMHDWTWSYLAKYLMKPSHVWHVYATCYWELNEPWIFVVGLFPWKIIRVSLFHKFRDFSGMVQPIFSYFCTDVKLDEPCLAIPQRCEMMRIFCCKFVS